MKSANNAIKELIRSTSNQLAEFKEQVYKITNPEELISLMGRLNEFGKKNTTEFIKQYESDYLLDFQTKIVNLCNEAEEMIIHDSKYSSLKDFSYFIKSTGDYWRDKIVTSKEEISDNYRMKALKCHETLEEKKALEFYAKAVSVNPDSFENWYERGNVLMDLGDFIEAIRSFEVALEIDPTDPDALCNLGFSLFNLGRYHDSLAYFEDALSVDSNHVQALIGLGSVYFRLGDYQNAEEPLEIALQIDNESIAGIVAITALYHDGFYDFEKAVEYSKKVLEIDKNNLTAKANLAESGLYSHKYYKNSIILADQVLKTNDEQYGYPMRLVKMCSLYFTGQIAEAAKSVQDFVNYYRAGIRKHSVNWHFRGLKKIVMDHWAENKISDEVFQIIDSLITLVETSDEILQKKIIDDLSSVNPIFAGSDMIKESKTRGKITVINTSEPNSTPGYYHWAVFLEPKTALDHVEKVKYTLHSTFSKRIREKSNRNEGFKLESRGWGEFQIKVDIFFDDGEKITKYHWLKLN